MLSFSACLTVFLPLRFAICCRILFSNPEIAARHDGGKVPFSFSAPPGRRFSSSSCAPHSSPLQGLPPVVLVPENHAAASASTRARKSLQRISLSLSTQIFVSVFAALFTWMHCTLSFSPYCLWAQGVFFLNLHIHHSFF